MAHGIPSPVVLAMAGSMLGVLVTGVGALLRRTCSFGSGGLGRPLVAGVASLVMAVAVFGLALPAGRMLAPTMDDLPMMAALVGMMVVGGFGFDLMRWVAVRMGRGWGWARDLEPALHDIPEGLAIGTAMAAPSLLSGLVVAAGVVLHNLLDGVEAASLAQERSWSPVRSLGMAALILVAEPAAAVAGALVASLWRPLLPWILLGTAGALVEMVRTEVVPGMRRA